MPASSSRGGQHLSEQHWWERLSQARRAPLDHQHLVEAYGQVESPELKQALVEHLAIGSGEPGVACLLELLEQRGREPQLVRALGLSNHPQAGALLLSWIHDPAVDQALLLASLEAWADQVPLEVIAEALQASSSRMRLAGLQLLQHHTARLEVEQLLRFCAEPLADFREPVVIATLAVLRRLDDSSVVAALKDLVLENRSLQLSQRALEAIGSMATPASVVALVQLGACGLDVEVDEEARRQLRSQFRHHDVMMAEIERLVHQGHVNPTSAAELSDLIASGF